MKMKDDRQLVRREETIDIVSSCFFSSVEFNRKTDLRAIQSLDSTKSINTSLPSCNVIQYGKRAVEALILASQTIRCKFISGFFF